MGGNTIIVQRLGKGHLQYKKPDFYSAGELKLRNYDDKEKNGYIKGKVVELIKDKLHYAPLAKIKFEDGSEILVPAVEGIYIGKEVYSGIKAPVDVGNILPLISIPEGTQISMIEKFPGDGGKYCRTSGSSGILLQKTDKSAIITLPSGRNIELNLYSRAIVGVVAGGGRVDKPFVKAGNKYYYTKAHHIRWPIVAAIAMNVADHPFGGKHKRTKGSLKPLPKNGYPIKYGKYGPKRTGRKKR